MLVPIPAECVAQVVGKGGVEINALRAAFPAASINMKGGDGCLLFVHSASPKDRAAIEARINKLLDDNFTKTLPMTDDFINLLKSSRADALRGEITDTMSLTLNMEKINQVRYKI